MSRWLPHPLISLLVFVAWVLLGQNYDIWRVVSGVLIALALGGLFARLDPPRVRLRRPHLMPRLAAHVVFDIVRSNVAVAAIVLGRRRSAVTSGFVEVPLALTDRYGLAMLACIITATPGTVWVSLSRDQRLMIHVLDLVDEAAWIRKIQDRYERPLLEMFE